MSESRQLAAGSVRLSQAQRARYWAAMLVMGLNTTGCALLNPAPEPAKAAPDCLAEQDEIKSLRLLLAEKDTLIRSQQAAQKSQSKELQASARLANRAQLKLTRLATQPETASRLAEVEVSLETLQSGTATARQQTLLAQAQRFLDAANAAYAKDDFAGAMARVSQASEIIGMAQDPRSGARSGTRRATVTFQTPIALLIRVDSNLRQQPHTRATILDVLPQGTALTAHAYRGDWLRIETEDGRSGWLLSTLTEARPDPL